MLSKSFQLILNVLSIIVVSIMMAKAEAKETPVSTDSTCKTEQAVENKSLKPAEQKMQQISKASSFNEEEPSELAKSPCRDTAPSETPDEISETPKDSDAPSENDVEQSYDPSNLPSDDFSSLGELPGNQPSISNQDSHDINLTVQFGGTPSTSGESIPTPEPYLPTEPETGSPEPPIEPSRSEGNLTPFTQPITSRAKSKHQQKSKIIDKEKQSQSKKLRKKEKRSKHQSRKRSTQKADKLLTRKDRQKNNHYKKVKSHIRRTPLKPHRKPSIRDKSHRDKLPLIRQKHNAKKHRVKQQRKSIRPSRRKLGGNFKSNSKRFPKVRRYRTQFHPKVKQKLAPRRIVRPSVYRLQRVHKRHR
jgi:hypothetical protein